LGKIHEFPISRKSGILVIVTTTAVQWWIVKGEKKRKRKDSRTKYEIHISSRVAGMGTNKNSARKAINDFTAKRRAVLDTAVSRIALRWSTLKYYFCIFLAINPLLTER